MSYHIGVLVQGRPNSVALDCDITAPKTSPQMIKVTPVCDVIYILSNG